MRVGSLIVVALSFLMLTAGADALSADESATSAAQPAPDRDPAHTHAHGDHSDVGDHASFAFFPGHEEVVDSLEGYRDHPWVTLHERGRSHDDRPILLAEVTDPESPVPVQDRVVTLILTQQHGNEPAGTPAALDLLHRITAGDPIADTLHDQVLLLLPMANPDGATDNRRYNAQDRDINRDHISLDTPEANIIHGVLRDWDVHVAMDHHEYGGIGLGHPSPVRIYDYDLTTLFPVHDNVREEARGAAEDLMYEGIWPATEEEGYSANEYGEVTVQGEPVDTVAGGPDPGILRNHLGLHHIAGLLVETLVGAEENPFHDAERRTAIHISVMDATLRYVHAHADRFLAAKLEALAAETTDPWTEYIEGTARGAIPDAFRLEANATEVLDVLGRHGIPNATVADADGTPIVDIRHDLRAHAAAALHPESSRALDHTAPVDLPEPMAQAAEPAVEESSGAAALVLYVSIVALVGLAGARRRHG